MSELIYRKNGDYLLPDLGLTEAERKPLGKYGRMRQRYLEESRPPVYEAAPQRQPDDAPSGDRGDGPEPSGQPDEPSDEGSGRDGGTQSPESDGVGGLMNNCKAQAEEMILSELIYA